MKMMRETEKRSRGFTLIELIVVMVILGILAVIAIPKFLDLAQRAKITATQTALGSLRSTLSIKYAENTARGIPAFPESLAADDFSDRRLPVNRLNGKNTILTVNAPPGGKATDGGFWYLVASGQAGAYSDGTVDTGGY
jgi:prepilin-type N-terminal cleavage/methylation domain-containing protein